MSYSDLTRSYIWQLFIVDDGISNTQYKRTNIQAWIRGGVHQQIMAAVMKLKDIKGTYKHLSLSLYDYNTGNQGSSDDSNDQPRRRQW
jgi:hypothetical protein